MEWIAEWDWENQAMFTSKACGSPKKPQTTDWEFEEEEIDAGSFNMSGQSGVSGSDVGNGSSAKSSISASIQCLPKEAMEISNVIFAASECSFGNLSRKKESNRSELAGSFSPVEALVGPGEPLVGLKLGKRTYFENNFAISKEKATSFSVVPVSSATAAKKTKSSCQTAPVARCQVEGCNLDLSSAKDYHRKHRVCEKHSKIPKVIIGGLELRFCQQCSRFHRLSEFDENKRSCRRRLSDHNARRRKPKQETIQFHSTRFSSSFYEAGQQMNFLISNTPLVHTRPAANLPWDSCGSKFLLTEGCQLNSEKAGVIGGKPTVVGIQHLHATNISDSSRFLSFKGTTSDNFVQGFKDPILSSSPDAALDLHRALSLLSSNTWGSCEQQLITFDEHMDVVGSVSMSPQQMDAVP